MQVWPLGTLPKPLPVGRTQPENMIRYNPCTCSSCRLDDGDRAEGRTDFALGVVRPASEEWRLVAEFLASESYH